MWQCNVLMNLFTLIYVLLQGLTWQSSSIKVQLTLGTDGSIVINMPPMPCKLQVVSCVLFKDKVYVTGIATEEEVGSRQVQVYSVNERKWSTLPEAPNYNAPAAIINGYFTLMGGRLTNDHRITNIVCSWIEEESQWVQRVPPMPTVRVTSGVCHHGDLLLVTGGVVNNDKHMVVKAVDVYNFSTQCWSTPRAIELPKTLRSHHVVAFEENIYLAAGATTFPHLNNEAWRARWSDVKAAVTQHSKLKSVWIPITAPPVLRSTLVSCDNSLLAVGGVEHGEPKEAIYEFVDGEVVDGKVDNC